MFYIFNNIYWDSFLYSNVPVFSVLLYIFQRYSHYHSDTQWLFKVIGFLIFQEREIRTALPRTSVLVHMPFHTTRPQHAVAKRPDPSLFLDLSATCLLFTGKGSSNSKEYFICQFKYFENCQSTNFQFETSLFPYGHTWLWIFTSLFVLLPEVLLKSLFLSSDDQCCCGWKKNSLLPFF